MKKISIYEYYAHNCPADSYELISKDGKYRRPASQRELERMLKDYVNKNGEKGLVELAKIHPDSDLIKLVCDCNNKDKKQEKKENFSNANGITDSQTETINLSKMMIYGGFILVGIALIMKK